MDTAKGGGRVSTAIAKQKTASIRHLLEGDAFRQQVSKSLPTHLKPDRFIRIALTTMMRTPKLAECDQASFFNSLLTLSQLGIEPDGRRAHLIPFNNTKRRLVECQLIVDYKGLAELAMRSGVVSNLHADVVCENDVFEYDCGEIKSHRIDFRKPRGAVYAAYAICRFKDGSSKCDVMDRESVEAIRARSRAGNNGPWVTDWNEMAKKTVFRRLSKWLPLSPEFRDALEADDDDLPPINDTPAPVASLVEFIPLAEPEQEPEAPAAPEPAKAAEPAKPAAADKSPQDALADLVISNGYTWEHFVKAVDEGGSLPDATKYSGFDDIPTADCVRLIRGAALLARGLQIAKGAA